MKKGGGAIVMIDEEEEEVLAKPTKTTDAFGFRGPRMPRVKEAHASIGL